MKILQLVYQLKIYIVKMLLKNRKFKRKNKEKEFEYEIKKNTCGIYGKKYNQIMLKLIFSGLNFDYI